MIITDEDIDEILNSLVRHGFKLPFKESEEEAANRQSMSINRNALRCALLETKAWSYGRIY